MAESFFTSLQGWVKRELGSDYAGRYFGQLVAQVARIDPAPFRQFFWTETKNGAFRSRRMRIELEVEFLVGRRRRRSDLVVYLDDEPKLLVELKYRDSPTERHSVGSRQLDDYLALCRELASKPRFLLMHKEIQKDEDVRSIVHARQRMAHFGALAPFLQASTNPASAMLLEYMREEGLVIEPIDTDSLYRFLHRIVLPWGGSGRVNRTSTIDDGPRQFEQLLRNMRLLAADITPILRDAARARGARVATVDFSVTNQFQARAIRKLARNEHASDYSVAADARTGGVVEVWAQNALSSSQDWLYVSYGLEFHLAKGKPLRVEVFVCIESPEILRVAENGLIDVYGGTLPVRYLRTWKKGDLESEFLDLIREAARVTLGKRVVTSRRAIATLRRLQSASRDRRP